MCYSGSRLTCSDAEETNSMFALKSFPHEGDNAGASRMSSATSNQQTPRQRQAGPWFFVIVATGHRFSMK